MCYHLAAPENIIIVTIRGTGQGACLQSLVVDTATMEARYLYRHFLYVE